jgi:hypothetical protein
MGEAASKPMAANSIACHFTVEFVEMWRNTKSPATSATKAQLFGESEEAAGLKICS